MPILPTLLKRYDLLHRQHYELEQEIADVRRQILDAGRTARPRRRARRNGAEAAKIIRTMLEALRGAGAPLQRREIAERLGVTARTVAYRLKVAMRMGFVERVAKGRYRCTVEAATALS